MPMPGRAVKQSRLSVESILFNDTDEVLAAIEKLERSDSNMYYKSYETLRNILLERGVIELVADSRSMRSHMEPGAVLVGSRPQTLSRRSGLGAPLATGAHLATGAPLATGAHLATGAPLATGAAVFGPDTLETTIMKRERKRTIKTEREYARRLEEECQPYIMEANSIRQRIGVVSEQIRDLRTLLSYLTPKTQPNIEKMDKYMLLKLQKQENLMRLRDRLDEIRSIVMSIYRRYETPFDSVARSKIGGSESRTRTRTRRHKHKWSIKYKRSIDCKHPKGFSQRQHCKYGRKK
jgi:hypothetical protein